MPHVSSQNLIPMCILQILKEYSDENHPLTQDKIGYYLSQNYDITQERKAIGRSISKMTEELDIDIQSDKRGSWLASREFEDSELRMIIDLLMASRFLSESDSKDLIKRVCSLSSKYFESHIRHIVPVNHNKTTNRELFINIEKIDEAIEKKRVVEFRYLDPAYDYTTRHCIRRNYLKVSPYKIAVHNQKYYLIGHEEGNWDYGCPDYWRMDLIKDIRILDQEEEYYPFERLGIKEKNPRSYFSKILASPELAGGDLIDCCFLATQDLITEIDAAFDGDFTYREEPLLNHRGLLSDKSLLKVRLKTTAYAIRYFAITHLDYMRILSPESIRCEIEDYFSAGERQYRLQDEQQQYTAEEKNALKKIPFRDRIKLGLPLLFGKYPQNADGSKEPVEWLALEHDEKTAVLISRYILDASPYNEEIDEKTSWRDSALNRKTSTLNMFMIGEIGKLQPVQHEGEKDWFWILSVEEMQRYFKNTYQSAAEPTEYVKSKYGNDVDSENAARGFYWLRDVSEDGLHAAFVDSGGFVTTADQTNTYVDIVMGIRPVIRISLSEFEEDLEF